jgi:hypothetical protein
MSGVAFFVCGTPSNNRGFELVELGPEKLPGSPETYLDKAPPEAAECHRVESVIVDGRRYVQCSRVLRINPNDAEANRGAYIAVGCLIRERLALHAVANCLDVVAELHGRVSSALTRDRAFPAGFRLADFTYVGPPLEERAAEQCSPLLVADVVLQALNGEGPIDWVKSKEVLLTPAEMTSADAGRYQLYSRQGLLGSLASLDLDKARAQQTAQRATAAARALVELQHEWTELADGAERLIAKGEAFKHLTLEVDGAVKRDLEPGAAGDGRAERAHPASPAIDAGDAPYAGRRYQVAQAFRIGSSRGRVGYDAAVRRRSASQQRDGLRRSGLARASALVLTGSLLAWAAIIAVQKWRVPESTVAAAPPAVVEPESQAAEQQQPQPEQQQPEQQQPENDVARQRAALDAPNQ